MTQAADLVSQGPEAMRSAIVRIFAESPEADEERTPVGVGFLIDDQVALTCAHVVTNALGLKRGTTPPTGTLINLDLPLLTAPASGDVLTASIQELIPPEPSGAGDIAVLRLRAQLPGSRPVRLVEPHSVWGHRAAAFGLPSGRPGGVWHNGVLKAPQANGWILMNHDPQAGGFRVSMGFSGGPVWDETEGAVVGMTVTAEAGDPPVSYLISTTGLVAAWPPLRRLIHNRPLLPGVPPIRAYPSYVGGPPFTGRAHDLDTLDDWGQSADPVMVVEAMGGAGKSALTWEWSKSRAPGAVIGLAGRFWWSFYEGSPSMRKFLQVLVAYTSGRSLSQVQEMELEELADEASIRLRDRPYLVVLDGFERLLTAYHTFDPSRLRDEDVELGQRGMIESQADGIVRRLAAEGPSKILISTRLIPTVLQDHRTGQLLSGVQHIRLSGLNDNDTRELLTNLRVRGSAPTIRGFFGSLGNHPLLIGIAAGLVNDYRPAPGDFDRWLNDPQAGGKLRLIDLNLAQQSKHIVETALAGLKAWPRELLELLSALSGAVAWQTLDDLNPHRPQPPSPTAVDLTVIGAAPKPPNYNRFPRSLQGQADRYRAADRHAAELYAWRRRRERAIAQAREDQLTKWRQEKPVVQADRKLRQGLRDLEDRGLLWWDRAANTYDLHPIVRAYTYGQLGTRKRIKINDKLHSHFAALPAEGERRATTVEDLTRSITVFRALVGAGQLDEAATYWGNDLGETLQRHLGAHATVVELLTPVSHVRSDLRAALGISLWFMGRYSEAISEETSILADSLRQERAVHVRFALGNLTLSLLEVGSLAAAERGCELRHTLNTAVGIEEDGSLYLHEAMLAAIQGDAARAAGLLHQAEITGPAGRGLWHADHISYWRLNLALRADDSLTSEQLSDAATGRHSWQHRLDLAALRFEFFVRRQDYDRAAAAANEYERLSRNAGLDTVPARSAFVLTKHVGRRADADNAIEEAMARKSGIHPARFPHYWLARALWELGRPEAAVHADAAYRQAWCDGPPNCRKWDLTDAVDLLLAMGRPVPSISTTDPPKRGYPLERRVRRYIAASRTLYGGRP